MTGKKATVIYLVSCEQENGIVILQYMYNFFFIFIQWWIGCNSWKIANPCWALPLYPYLWARRGYFHRWPLQRSTCKFVFLFFNYFHSLIFSYVYNNFFVFLLLGIYWDTEAAAIAAAGGVIRTTACGRVSFILPGCWWREKEEGIRNGLVMFFILQRCIWLLIISV